MTTAYVSSDGSDELVHCTVWSEPSLGGGGGAMAQWKSAWLDSRPKGRGFEPHRRHCVAVLE